MYNNKHHGFTVRFGKIFNINGQGTYLKIKLLVTYKQSEISNRITHIYFYTNKTTYKQTLFHYYMLNNRFEDGKFQCASQL